MESRVRCEPYARFGRRPGETEQTATPHRAPGRPHLATGVVDEVRRRVQQDLHGHRGRRDDPLYRIHNILWAAQENFTDRQRARLEHGFSAHQRHVGVEVAWSYVQDVRSAYHWDTRAGGRQSPKNPDSVISSS